MTKKDNETLGQVVHRKRLQLGVSLRGLAKAVNTDQVSILRIERDQFNKVDPAIIKDLADVLHMDRLFMLSLKGSGVEDKDVRIFARAIAKMKRKERASMMKMLREEFPEAFAHTRSDDLDKNY